MTHTVFQQQQQQVRLERALVNLVNHHMRDGRELAAVRLLEKKGITLKATQKNTWKERGRERMSEQTKKPTEG